MTRARYLVGDVFDRLAEIPDGSVDLVMTSPPFLALRSYLPAGHPDKHKEIGSEATPADFLDTLLALTAEWGRVLAPHGSICVELGDTYAGSGGAGGDYNPNGLREGQPRFRQNNLYGSGSADGSFHGGAKSVAGQIPLNAGPGWPLDKSLTGIPTLYAWSLAYGRNLLRAPLSGRELLAEAVRLINDDAAELEPREPMSATKLVMQLGEFLRHAEEIGPTREYERWRIRNLVAWVRPNPPVGALGDKFRPATSYLTIACRARDRWFDLDAVRTQPAPHTLRYPRNAEHYSNQGYEVDTRGDGGRRDSSEDNPAGAPPLDWWNHADLLIDNEIAQRAGKTNGWSPGPKRTGKQRAAERGGRWTSFPEDGSPEAQHLTVGAQGSHIRRRLEQAGYLGGPTDDVWDIAPSGYPGAHYAVYPPELCVRPILAMCPRRVCITCGEPSRRIVEASTEGGRPVATKPVPVGATSKPTVQTSTGMHMDYANRTTLGWSDCGHNTWRPGHVLDPFAGTGTTLAVATGHGRTATGIDIDPRNAELAQQRLGMFLDIHDNPTTEPAA